MRAKTTKIHRKRRKKVLKRAKGFRGAKSRNYRIAKQAVMRALMASYIGRKLKKRNFRRLWIARINASLRQLGLNYSKFMGIMKKKGIEMDRKVLAYFASEDPQTFSKIVQEVVSGESK